MDRIFELNPSMNAIYPGEARYIRDIFYVAEGQGEYFDLGQKEIIEGAEVKLAGSEGEFSAITDNYGDFWLKELPEADFTLTITNGDKTKTLEVSTKGADVGLGDIPFE